MPDYYFSLCFFFCHQVGGQPSRKNTRVESTIWKSGASLSPIASLAMDLHWYPWRAQIMMTYITCTRLRWLYVTAERQSINRFHKVWDWTKLQERYTNWAASFSGSCLTTRWHKRTEITHVLMRSQSSSNHNHSTVWAIAIEHDNPI